ncbi:unnamed protein product, partial [Didymodactylos carnosus]
DEISETEHIRTNLAIERSIAEGCEVLLDVNQVLCRQDSLVLLTTEKSKSIGQRFSREMRRGETVVQCYLFSNHLILTTRASSGKLHLAKGCGCISLADVTLVEDITSDPQHFLASVNEEENQEDLNITTDINKFENGDDINRMFRLIVEARDQPPYSTTLLANDEKHKQEWCTDIAQCLQNLRYTELVQCSFRNESSVVMPESVKSDVKLFKDNQEIKYSKTLDSCKIPQIRHATVEKLLERLTDLRFLSIDFLNTFLLTYRLYTNAYTIVETLIKVYKSSPHTSVDTGDVDKTDGQRQNPVTKEENELTRLVEERDLRRHSHIGSFRRGLSIEQHDTTITTAIVEPTSPTDTKIVTTTTAQLSGNTHSYLAPLASSETLTDVTSISSFGGGDDAA